MTRLPKSLILLVVLASSATSMAWADGGVTIGKPAPKLSGKDLDGNPLSLAKLKGKVVIVDFWASWCAPCKEEMPVLERLKSKYGKYGLAIVGVSVDGDAGKAGKFLRDLKVTFPSIHDASHAIAERYRPKKMPTSILIDRKGTVRFIHAGFKAADAKAIEREVRSLLQPGK